LRLNNYIVTSLLFHILLLGILVVFHPEMNTEASAPIFDVDIVGSIGEEGKVPKTIKIPVRPSPSVSKESEGRELSPETMFGQGTESEPAESSKEETADGEPFTDKESILPEGTKGLPSEPKSFLFDKETIEKYARKDTTKGKDLTFDVPEFHHRGYMRMLKDKIESIWKYPKWATRRGISGDLYIRFSIKKDGSLGEVELIRTSGYKELDEAAMKALKDGEPYWPLPDDWEGDELSITGHFIYLIGRSYII
jgi:protein TonB